MGKFCKICTKQISDGNYEKTNKLTVEIFDSLLLKPHLDIKKKPIICKPCMVLLQKSFDFKCMCLYTEDIIVPLVKYVAAIDMKEVYLKKNTTAKIGDISGRQKICRLCVRVGEKKSFFPLNKNDKKTRIVIDSLETYLAEVHLNAIKEPVICTTCLNTLKEFSKFMDNYSELANKRASLNEKESTADARETSLETEAEIDMITDTDESITNVEAQENEVQNNLKEDKVHSNPEKVATKRRRKRGKYNMKPKQIIHYECDSCPYATINKYHFTRHQKTHTRKNKSYKCDDCPYKTHDNACLDRHKKTHESVMYECENCSFKTKRDDTFRKHKRCHENPSQVKLYKCTRCDFETFHKNVRDYHQLNHENSADIEMKKCYFCDFQSRHRSSLREHLRTHREVDDSDKIKCSECDYLAKDKHRLRKHMLTHMDPSNMKVFKCTVCAYQSKYKYGLKKHMVIHQDPANTVMYHCDICPYKTIRKEQLP
ncbi:hypothetical protein NQ317_019180 [Molorchus minor]|uniref:C2H2-type domain-containing protein n=1 Tax=Molorchus minor TaxID=1323400 RepID=A0ABQ9J5A9_9CUCU|nr:hypothetical protein NQ317_019180 [Molorchus minor]